MKKRVVVYHGRYGCETGCCGHIVEMGEKTRFFFEHPDRDVDDALDFAKQLVTEAFGEEHVADLDWENCHMVDIMDC